MSDPTPVYGPGRRDAAISAVRALRNAQAAYDAAPMFSDWTRPAHITARLERARIERALYPEYGDSMADAL